MKNFCMKFLSTILHLQFFYHINLCTLEINIILLVIQFMCLHKHLPLSCLTFASNVFFGNELHHSPVLHNYIKRRYCRVKNDVKRLFPVLISPEAMVVMSFYCMNREARWTFRLCIHCRCQT